MIRLVSPNHLGGKTPREIQDKILDLLLTWSVQYPKETKIKIAYDMLIQQPGVIHDPPKSIRFGKKDADVAPLSGRPNKREESDFDKIPKELLLSKDPKDIQAANLLIEKYVEEVCLTLRIFLYKFYLSFWFCRTNEKLTLNLSG